MTPFTHFLVVASLLGAVALFGAFPVQVPGAAPQPVLVASHLALPGLAPAAQAGSIPGEIEAAPIPLTVYAPMAITEDVFDASDETAETLAAIEDAQRGSAVDVDVVASRVEDRIPQYLEHEIQEGETLSSIAEHFGIGVDYIKWNNLDIENPNILKPGTVLLIPTVEGIIHPVRFGETVTEIAARYDAEPEAIIEFAANGLRDNPNNLRAEWSVLVPGGRIIPPKPQAPASDSAGPGPVAPGGWSWPAAGRNITSWFGPGHPLGIDIAMPVGSPLYAARGGTVSFVGGNPCCSYGLHIIIDHGDGYETVYAHLSSGYGFQVSEGQWVEGGTLIAYSGNTGNSTGPHLHFEVRRNGVHQNPISFLP